MKRSGEVNTALKAVIDHHAAVAAGHASRFHEDRNAAPTRVGLNPVQAAFHDEALELEEAPLGLGGGDGQRAFGSQRAIS